MVPNQVTSVVTVMIVVMMDVDTTMVVKSLQCRYSDGCHITIV